jgi:hypothetical protein
VHESMFWASRYVYRGAGSGYEELLDSGHEGGRRRSSALLDGRAKKGVYCISKKARWSVDGFLPSTYDQYLGKKFICVLICSPGFALNYFLNVPRQVAFHLATGDRLF